MQTTKETSLLLLGEPLMPFDKERLKEAIIDLYHKGYRTLYTPLFSDFERAAAEITFELNQFKIDNRFPNLHTIVVVYNFSHILHCSDIEQTTRVMKILDRCRGVIHTKALPSHLADPTTYIISQTSLMLTNLDPKDQEITCEEDEYIQIEDAPTFVAYNTLNEYLPIVIV